MVPCAIDELEARFGTHFVRRRLALEAARAGASLFVRWKKRATRAFIRGLIRSTGLQERGLRNSRAWRVRHHEVVLPGLPEALDGLTLLHLSDLHADLDPTAMKALAHEISELEYDLALLTGDYRNAGHGPIEPAMAALAPVCDALHAPAFGVLGNHDSLLMVPALEAMGVRMLVNETARVTHAGAVLRLAGIDDAHHYRTHDLAAVAPAADDRAPALLLSHTPEVFREAARAGFHLMLAGHTHGGQICLPGGIPLTLEARCPRALGRGSWRHDTLQGYTTTGAGCCIVSARFNCPPEVVLHRLRRPPGTA